jgi:hypothetical protein
MLLGQSYRDHAVRTWDERSFFRDRLASRGLRLAVGCVELRSMCIARVESNRRGSASWPLCIRTHGLCEIATSGQLPNEDARAPSDSDWCARIQLLSDPLARRHHVSLPWGRWRTWVNPRSRIATGTMLTTPMPPPWSRGWSGPSPHQRRCR